MSLLNVDSRADHSLGLHLRNLRIGNRQTASTVTHHGVKLVERSDNGLDLLNGLALSVSQLLDVLLLGGNKLMERRIQETDTYRVALKSLIQLLKVSLLYRKDLLQSSFSLLNSVGADHLAERVDPVALKEHVLGTAKADSLSTQLSGLLGVSRSICVGSYFQSSVLVSPAHDPAELACDGSVYRRNNTIINITRGAVQRQPVALMVLLACQDKLLVLLVHSNVRTAGYTAGTHAAGNNGRMACHTAADSQDTLGRLHTLDIFRRSLKTNQNYLLTSCSPLFCVFRSKYHLAAGSAR